MKAMIAQLKFACLCNNSNFQYFVRWAFRNNPQHSHKSTASKDEEEEGETKGGENGKRRRSKSKRAG